MKIGPVEITALEDTDMPDVVLTPAFRRWLVRDASRFDGFLEALSKYKLAWRDLDFGGLIDQAKAMGQVVVDYERRQRHGPT